LFIAYRIIRSIRKRRKRWIFLTTFY
jgi:hypothetical protein